MTSDEELCRTPYINRHNHDPRLPVLYPPPQPTMGDLLYGNPYYTLLRPIGHTVQFHQWAYAGSRRGLVNYPAFVDAKSGSIIVSERDNHRLQIFDSVGSLSRFDRFGCRGNGANQFESPGGVTTTNEHYAKVVVADTGNRRVCLFRASSDHQGYGVLNLNFYFGHQIFQAPTGVEWDNRRNMLAVADQVTKRVSLHDMRTGQCCGEFRPRASIPLLRPTDVTIDSNGLWYVSDNDGHSIHVYESSGDFVCRIGGVLGSSVEQFNQPSGMCIDRSDNLIVADEGNSRILMYRSRDGGRAACSFQKVITTDVYVPKAVSINVHENLVVCDCNSNNFLKIFKYK